MHYLVGKIKSERGNLFSILSTTTLGLGASFLMMLAFANLLDPNSLGIYQYLISVVSLIGSVSLTGANTAIIRATGKKDYGFLPEIFKYTLYSFLLALVLAVAVSFYYGWQGNYYLAFGIFVSSVIYLFLQYLSRYNSIYVGIGEFKISNYLLKAGALGPVFVLLPALFYISNPAVLTILFFGSSALFTVFIIWRYKMYQIVQKLISSKSVAIKENSTYLRFAFHQSVITLISGAAAHLDKIIIFQMLGAEATAIYYITISIPDRLRGLLRQFEPYLFSKFLGYSAGNYNDHLTKKFFITVLGIIPFIILYAISAHYIFDLFFPQYVGAVSLTMIYSISLLATAGILPFSSMKAHSTNRSFYDYTIVYNVFKITLFIILTIQLGILGSVVATTISSSLTSFYLLYLALNRKNILGN